MFSGLSAGLASTWISHDKNISGSAQPYTVSPNSKSLLNSFPVSPYAGYSKEAAPMGIADFGYSSSTGAYSYNTTSFVGKANLTGLYTYNSSLGAENNVSSLQLNLNLQFKAGGVTYTYWVQNVAKIYSGTNGVNHYITLIDNIWNFTGSHANLQPSGISGNGSVNTYSSGGNTYSFYYDYAPNLPGNNISLPENFSIELKALSAITQNGTPEVVLSYNDGYGWQIYDNIYFTFAAGSSRDSGFVVDGNTYNPGGSFYDAELILGGPGDGMSTVLQSGSARLALQYWNGHNYNNPISAYNFGGDTGETVSNVKAVGGNSVPTATFTSELTAGGGSLGMIYSAQQTGILNLTLPDRNASVQINNETYRYTGYDLNLTLYEGDYNITVPLGSGIVLSGSVNITGNSYSAIGPSYFDRKYSVNITENGIPAGIAWSIVFPNGTVVSSNESYIQLLLRNGTYTVNLTGPSGYLYIPVSLRFSVNGNDIVETATFNRSYNVTFYQTGLNGLEWFVTLNGKQENTIGPWIAFTMANGTYNYTVQGIQGYTVSPASGTATVSGSNVSVIVDFALYLYRVTFRESGLPANNSWGLYIGGSWYYSNNTTVVIFLQNGSYSYTAIGDGGSYMLKGSNATFLMSGKGSVVNLTLVSSYNGGIYLMQKLISLALLLSVITIGGIAVRRLS